MASSILTPHNGCNTTDAQNFAEFEFGLEREPYDNYTAPRTNLHPQGVRN